MKVDTGTCTRCGKPRAVREWNGAPVCFGCEPQNPAAFRAGLDNEGYPSLVVRREPGWVFEIRLPRSGVLIQLTNGSPGGWWDMVDVTDKADPIPLGGAAFFAPKLAAILRDWDESRADLARRLKTKSRKRK